MTVLVKHIVYVKPVSRDDRKRGREAKGGPAGSYHLYTGTAREFIYFYGVCRPILRLALLSLWSSRSRRSGREERREERVWIVEREGGDAGITRPSLSSPVPAGDTLRSKGEKPRARLMALRGCHGYGEPHGTDATAAPSGKPIYSGKTL